MYILPSSFHPEEREIKEKNLTWKINQKITCQSYNLVYMIICSKESCQQKIATKIYWKSRKKVEGQNL